MKNPTLDQLVRRLIAGAFDAGVAAASRPASARNSAREDQVGYAGTILAANVAAEATRLATAASLTTWQDPA